MSEFKAGEVVVPVIPETTGFVKKLRKDLFGELNVVGRDIGREITNGIRQGLGDPYAPLREQTKQQQARAPKDGEEVGGAFARGFKAKLEAALRSLPKASIDADSTAADIKIAAIRESIASLSGKTVGVDIDAGAAEAELAVIREELASIDGDTATADVRADVAAALAELGVVKAELSSIDGKTANARIDVDASGAFATIGAVSAALAALAAGPVVATIGAGIAGIGAGLVGAGIGVGAFAAAAGPALGRVSAAVKEADKATSSAGGSTRSAGQAAAQAAQQGLQLEQAEQRITAAKKTAKQAEEDLTQARKDAKQAIDDLRRSVEDQALSEESASLSVEEARVRLNQVLADPKATDLEKRRADLNYREAVQHLEDQKARTKDLKAQSAAADKAGVEGSAQVKAAKDKLAQSNQAVLTAEKQLLVLQKQQAAAMQSSGGSAGGLASKFAALSKSEKALVGDIQSFNKTYRAWQASLAPDIFKPIRNGIKLAQDLLPEFTPLAKAAAAGLNTLVNDARKGFQDPFWDKFRNNLAVEIPGAIRGLGSVVGNVFVGIAGAVNAILPHANSLISAAQTGSARFAEWGKNLDANSGFQSFITKIKTDGPLVWQTVKDLAVSVGNIVKAITPFVPSTLGGLQLLASITAGMSPSTIQLIALAVGAVYTAVKAGQAASAGLQILGDLKTKISEAGSAAGPAKSKLSVLTGFLGSGGVWGIAIGAAIGALGLLGKSHAETEQKVKDMTQALIAAKGAITDETRQGVIKDLVDQGVLKDAKTLGLNLNDVASAALGDHAALKKVNEALNASKVPLDVANAKAGASRFAMHGLSQEALNVSNAIGGQNKQLASSREGYALNTLANINLSTSIKNTKAAIDAAGGSMAIGAAKTAAQKGAVDQAKTSFNNLLGQVKQTADAQQILSGKSGTARQAILDQLQPLLTLAGNNKAARDKVIELAGAYGISRAEIDKLTSAVGKIPTKAGPEISTPGYSTSIASIDHMQTAADKLGQTKPAVGVTANVQPALDTINQLITTISGKVIRIGLDIRSENQEFGARKPQAYGGIERYAKGGVRPPAYIAQKPTVLFGESGPEAYIPLDPGKRKRGLDVLKQAAAIMGQSVVPQGALDAAGFAGLMATSGLQQFAAGGTVGVSAVRSTTSREISATLSRSTSVIASTLSTTARDIVVVLGGTSTTVANSLSNTSSAVSSTLTNAGTSVAGSIGAAATSETASAGKLVTATTDMTAAMTKQIDALKLQVAELQKALTAASANAAASATKTVTTKAATAAKKTASKSSKTGGKSGIGVTATLSHALRNVVEPILSSTLIAPEATAPAAQGAYSHYGTSFDSSLTTSAPTTTQDMQGTSNSAGAASLVTINGGFHATPEQSPYAIANDLKYLLGSQLRMK